MAPLLRLATSRALVNGIYLVVPPVGLLFMYASPDFTARERATRTAITAGFVAFFMAAGPQLQAYVNNELARLL